MAANDPESIKINNRKAAHSQHAYVLKQKRHGSGKGGWGDPMDDLKYLNQDPAKNPQDPNFEPDQPNETQSQDVYVPQGAEARGQESSEYFQNFQSDVESLSAFKIKVEDLVNEYLYDVDEEKFTASLNELNCPNFFNQVPKVLLWTVVGSKKQEHFPATRKLLMHLRATNTISKIQLESAFRRLFHRLNELSIINSNAYIILVDFGEYCVARNLMEDEFLSQLKKQTEFAKDPQRIERLKKHVQDIIAEFFSSGDIDEAIRCVAEMDTPFYNHEVVKRIISTAFDHTNRERELTSQFLARAVGDNLYNENDTNYAIPRKNCELGFMIMLQRVEGLYKDVPDVLELLSSFIGRAIVDEVLAPAFIDNVDLLETDMGYAVIKHVKHLLSGPRHSDQLLNVWGTNSSKSIQSMKTAISNIIKEYLISRELDEALTAIQELNIPMFHHEIIKQLIPSVADYYVAKDLQQNNGDDGKSVKIREKLKIPQEIADKAIQIQLAIDLISTALQHNIMATEQVRGGFKRLKERMEDYKLDAPLFEKYYECVRSQFEHIMVEKEEDETKEVVTNYGGAKERKIDEEIEQIAKQSKDLVIEYVTKRKMDIKLETFKAIQCKTQTVAGINYFIKIKINETQCIHAFIWRKLDQSMELLGVDLNKTEADELVFKKEKEEKEKVTKKKKVGGLKDKEVDELVVSACNRIKDQVVSQNKESAFTEFSAIKAKSQVVAGTNLFVKVKVDKNRFIHIRVWCKLDSSCELTSVEWNKNEDDEIVYF